MRWFGALSIVLATVFPVSAEDWSTADGKTYKNVVVIAQEEDGVRVTYTGGVGKIPYYELPLDLQKRFGEDYDSLKAKRKAAEKAQEEATRIATATAEQKKQQDAAAAAAAEQKRQQDEAAAALLKKRELEKAAQSKVKPVAKPQPIRLPVKPPAPAAPIRSEEEILYPGSKFSYEESRDVCYLDSPAVNVALEDAPDSNSPSPGTLTLRITTYGHKPAAPDKIKATFLSVNTIGKLAGDRKVNFFADGTYVPINKIEVHDGNASSNTGQVAASISFYLTPKQAKLISQAKEVSFSVGTINYRIDPAGISIFQKYFNDVDKLPPASVGFIQSFRQLLDWLPSLTAIISTTCQFVLLGSFSIVIVVCLTGLSVGVFKFMKK